MSTFINLLDIVYPVGSIYQSFDSASPASTVGGTWEQITGRFLYADESSGSTGGSDSYVFEIDQDNSAAAIGATGARAETIGYVPAKIRYYTSTSSYTVFGTSYTTDTRAFNHHSRIYGQTYSKTVMPPYITCYMWRRTA